MKKLFLILLSGFLFSCSSDDDSSSQSPNPSNYVAFFKASIDGQSFDYLEDNSQNPSHYHSFGNGFNGNGFDKSYYYSGYMVPNNGFLFYPSIDLTFHNMLISSSDTEETNVFYDLFDDLPSNFISYDDDNNNWIEGVSLTYIDENENYYSTLGGNQNGSSVSYSGVTTGTDGGLLKTVTVTGTINCKLYNQDNLSDVKVVTNGSFKLIFREYY